MYVRLVIRRLGGLNEAYRNTLYHNGSMLKDEYKVRRVQSDRSLTLANP